MDRKQIAMLAVSNNPEILAEQFTRWIRRSYDAEPCTFRDTKHFMGEIKANPYELAILISDIPIVGGNGEYLRHPPEYRLHEGLVQMIGHIKIFKPNLPIVAFSTAPELKGSVVDDLINAGAEYVFHNTFGRKELEPVIAQYLEPIN